MKKVIMGSVMFALGTLSVLGVWTYHMFEKFLYAAYDYGTQFGGMELTWTLIPLVVLAFVGLVIGLVGAFSRDKKENK